MIVWQLKDVSVAVNLITVTENAKEKRLARYVREATS
jgi:hypothetical protein